MANAHKAARPLARIVAMALAFQPTTEASAGAHRAARPASASSRIDAQRRLFDQQAEADRRRSPEGMSAAGDLRSNGLLDDRSIGAEAAAARQDRMFHRRLSAIPTQGMPEEDATSHDLMLFLLEQRLADHRLRMFELRVWNGGGVHEQLAALPDSMPFDTAAHYRDYIRRLRAVPRALAQSTAMLERARGDGMMPPRAAISGLPGRVDAIIRSNPFAGPADAMPAGIEPRRRIELRHAILRAVNIDVLPALERFSRYLRDRYVPAGRPSWSESTLPNGAAIYRREIAERTTTALGATEIHALGLSEVARIDDELERLARHAGFPTLAAYRASLASDPRYAAGSAQRIVDDFRRHVGRMQPLLPMLFRDPPATRLLIEPMKPGDLPAVTHHVDGSPDGRTPGRILVATDDPGRRSLVSDETIAYHEGLPGHELQVAIAQRVHDLPRFRREQRFDAYVEGWAVYAETLGKEVGLFSESAAEYGRLNTELLRALRLVMDTGIHADGWTREQAVSYLRDSGAVDEPTIAAEVDRSERWPAQGLAYKIGQLRIAALRRRAEDELGDRFDVRDFHAAVLGGGSLPLNLLETRIDAWIDRERGPRASWQTVIRSED